MKFGKKFREHQVEGCVYIDYKALKRLIKELSGGSTETAFRQELWNGMHQVNAFFLQRENALLADLPAAVAASGSDESGAFFEQVAALRSYAVLNYLACLKICKKHDKQSASPVREAMVDHMFTQASYLSLEHSYLFSQCEGLIEAAPPPADAAAAVGSPRRPGESAMDYSSADGDTLDVPSRFERCIMRCGPCATDGAGSVVPAPGDQRWVELEIERILGLVAGGARRSCFLPKQLKGGAPPAWAARAVSDTPPARSPRSPIPLSLIPPSPRTGLSASEGPGLRLHAVPRPGAPRRTSPSATSHGSSANTLEEDMVFDLAL